MPSKHIVLLLVGLLLIGLFFALDLDRFLTLASLKANHRLLLDYYARHRSAMILGFIAVYVTQTVLALPGAALMSLAAGAIFGPLAGTLYATIGATIGASLAFLVSRFLLRDLIRRHFGAGLDSINRELEQRGVYYLLFIRLVPIFPFFLVNYAAGLTHLPLRLFTLTTLIGIVPAGFVFVNAGASLATIETLGDVASPRVLGSFALLGLFALVPALYAKFTHRRPT